ncbi:unnamed protein product, partial [Dibothriocephalus latus]
MEDQGEQQAPPTDGNFPQPAALTSDPQILETPEDIRNRRNQVLDRYAAFKEATDERRRRLEEAKRYQYFKRDADELESWMLEKLQTYQNEDFKDLANLQSKKQKHQALELEVKAQSETLASLDKSGEEMISQNHYASEIIRNRLDDLHALWDKLMAMFREKSRLLNLTLEYVQFLRRVDEILFWIREKETFVTSEEFGQDLEHVETLQKKYDEFVKDLEYQEGRAAEIYTKADELIQELPEETLVMDKKREVQEALERLKDLARKRQQKLFEAHEIQRFFRDTDKTISWINEKSIPLSVEDCGRDLVSVQALQRKHEALERDLAALEDKVTQLGACMEEGQRLVDAGHPTSGDIVAKMNTLERERAALLALWDERRIQFEQCMDLQLFYRDAEQAETWMAKQEAFLDNKDVGDSLDAAEALIRKQEDFEKSLAAQEEKIKHLEALAGKLVDGGHYASPEIASRKEALLQRRTALQEKAALRHNQLEDSHRYHMFDRDADEIKAWIVEKLKTATDESYKDPTNLQTKVQKHHNFESEINANQPRIEDVKKMGTDLLDANHYKSDDIRARINELDDLWAKLIDAMTKKGKNLEQANNQQQFVRNIEDIEIWLSEVEAQVASDDQ